MNRKRNKIYSISEIQKYAKLRHWQFLSDKYENMNTSYEWRCLKCKTKWKNTFWSAKKRTKCPTCSGIKQYSISDMQKFARQRGGECISNIYRNMHHKLWWRCKKGHEWSAIPHSVIDMNTWCPECSPTKKHRILDLQKFAKKKKGKLLSREYINANTKYWWQCHKKHEFPATFSSLKNQGTWCPKCSKNARLLISEVKAEALRRGIKILSNSYKNAKARLKVRCSCGMIWHTNYDSIKSGRKCQDCARNKKYDLNRLRAEAAQRKGRCLAKVYNGAREPVMWECESGHRWPATPSQVIRGSWCPMCDTSKAENMCRVAMESLFGVRFNQVRFTDLVNRSTGRKLQIDGYNRIKKLAFEHDGAQHFREVAHFKDQRSLADRKRLDAIKNRWCKKNGILLIRFKQVTDLNPEDRVRYIKSKIEKSLKKDGRDLPTQFRSKNINFRRAYHKHRNYNQKVKAK